MSYNMIAALYHDDKSNKHRKFYNKIIPFDLNYESYPEEGSVEISWASGEIDSSIIKGFSFRVTSLKRCMSLILENGVDLAVETSMPGNQIWLIIIREHSIPDFR